MNLLDLFAIPLARAPHAVALRERDANGAWVEISFSELFERAERAAVGLAARGLGRGDRVGFFLGNRAEFVIAYLAAIRLGAIVVPINLAYRKVELAHILTDAEPRLVITERERLPRIEELQGDERVSVREVLLVEEIEDWSEGRRMRRPYGRPDGETVPASMQDSVGPIGEQALDNEAVAEDAVAANALRSDDLAFLLYTSGTTGRSKGAMISHGNLVATISGLLVAWAWQPRDVLLLALPLFHTHGLVVGLHCALAAGATVELHPKFEAPEIVDRLVQGDATMFFGVPTMYVRLIPEIEARPASQELASAFARLRLFCSGSAPLAPETFARFQELSGHAILERYGMTETGMLLSNPYVGTRRPGTVGTPLPGVSARIVDANGQIVPEGQEGELWVDGGNVFSGYWRAPEKTAESFANDESGRRWFRTGDLARRDPQHGAITLLGRRGELILSGGFNVYPREIEEVLATAPGIREAAIVGRPHPEWGQVPVAYVVADHELAPLELIAFLKERIAGFKIPRTFHRVDTLPKNALGKVLKHLL